MSLLFCVWADQQEEREDSEKSSSDKEEDEAEAEKMSEDVESVENKEKNSDKEDGKEKDKEPELEPERKPELEPEPKPDPEPEPSKSDTVVLAETRKKPLVGPRSFKQKMLEKERQERERLSLNPGTSSGNGLIIFNTLQRQTEDEDTEEEEQEEEEDQMRPKFFSFTTETVGRSEAGRETVVSTENHEDEDQSRPASSEPMSPSNSAKPMSSSTSSEATSRPTSTEPMSRKSRSKPSSRLASTEPPSRPASTEPTRTRGRRKSAKETSKDTEATDSPAVTKESKKSLKRKSNQQKSSDSSKKLKTKMQKKSVRATEAEREPEEKNAQPKGPKTRTARSSSGSKTPEFPGKHAAKEPTSKPFNSRQGSPTENLVTKSKGTTDTVSISKSSHSRAKKNILCRGPSPEEIAGSQEVDRTRPAEKETAPARREVLKRKARPHTFSHVYDMDPESPFLYTSDRRKGPGVSLERDEEEEDEEDQDRGVKEEDDDDDEYMPFKKIKTEPRGDITSPELGTRRYKKEEPEIFGFGISLGSVFSLADGFGTRTRSSVEPIIIKNEPFEDWSESFATEYQGYDDEDPLGDPLALKTTPEKKRKRPFIWPKLDPLFLTLIEYRLPRDFDPYIKALAKPTAEIVPIPKTMAEVASFKPYFSGKGPSVTITSLPKSSRINPPPTFKRPETESVKKPADGLRRSNRKSKGKYEMKELLDDYPSDQFADEMKGSRRPSGSRPSPSTSTPRQPPGTPTKSPSLPKSLTQIIGSGLTITPIRDGVPSSSSSPFTFPSTSASSYASSERSPPASNLFEVNTRIYAILR